MSETGTPPSVAEQALRVSAAQFVNGRKPDGAAENKQSMPSKGKKRLPLTFHGQKAFAWAQGVHLHCPHARCRKLKKCTGGPRGTFRKHGKPHCKTPEAQRLIRQKISRIRERNRIRELERHIPQKR